MKYFNSFYSLILRTNVRAENDWKRIKKGRLITCVIWNEINFLTLDIFQKMYPIC